MITNDIIDTSSKPLTLESMMAAFDARMTRFENALERQNAEWERRNAEREREKAEQKAEQEKRNAEREREKAEQKAEQEKRKAEREREKAEQKAEQEKRNAEREREKAEREREKAEQKAEWEKRRAEREKENAKREKEIENVWKQIAETDKQIKATDKQIKATNKQIGGMGNSNGDFAQEFFYNALYHGNRKLFGLQFDHVRDQSSSKNKKTGVEFEYDAMLLNCNAVCIVEAKYKADIDDVQKTLKKEKPFRDNFPEHADKPLYFALASMSFDKRVKKACQEAGIAMIKQVGDTIEVYDEHLKVF